MAGDAVSAISAVTTLVGGLASGYQAIKGFGSKPKTPKMPTLPKPAIMPTMDDASVKAAQMAELRRVQSGSGRESTILTDETLGTA